METKQNSTEEKCAHAAPKKWADVTPAGLVALAIACAGFFALLNGYVDHSAMPLLGCWLLGGFVVQLIVALTDLKEGKTAAGNTFTYFCAFFMLVGGIEMLVKHKYGIADVAVDARIDGYAWTVLTLVTWAWTPAFFKKINLISFIVAFLDLALPFIALSDLKLIPSSLTQISAWCFLICSLIAVYLSAAIVVNTTYEKKIFPNF